MLFLPVWARDRAGDLLRSTAAATAIWAAGSSKCTRTNRATSSPTCRCRRSIRRSAGLIAEQRKGPPSRGSGPSRCARTRPSERGSRRARSSTSSRTSMPSAILAVLEQAEVAVPDLGIAQVHAQATAGRDRSLPPGNQASTKLFHVLVERVAAGFLGRLERARSKRGEHVVALPLRPVEVAGPGLASDACVAGSKNQIALSALVELRGHRQRRVEIASSWA